MITLGKLWRGYTIISSHRYLKKKPRNKLSLSIVITSSFQTHTNISHPQTSHLWPLIFCWNISSFPFVTKLKEMSLQVLSIFLPTIYSTCYPHSTPPPTPAKLPLLWPLVAFMRPQIGMPFLSHLLGTLSCIWHSGLGSRPLASYNTLLSWLWGCRPPLVFLLSLWFPLLFLFVGTPSSLCLLMLESPSPVQEPLLLSPSPFTRE